MGKPEMELQRELGVRVEAMRIARGWPRGWQERRADKNGGGTTGGQDSYRAGSGIFM